MPGYDILDTLTEEEKEMYYKRFAADLELQPNGECLFWKRKSDIMSIKGVSITLTRFLGWYHQIKISEKSKLQPTCGTIRCFAKCHMHFFRYPDTKAEMLHYLQNRAILQEDGCKVIKDMKLDKDGYAQLYLFGKQEKLHRVVFWCGQPDLALLTDIPENKIVAHMCRNNTCVLPNHYELVSQSINTGAHRQRDGTSWTGERHPNAQIDESTAKSIIASWSWIPKKTAVQRAKHFDVPVNIVYKIDHRSAWTHLPHPNGKVQRKQKQPKRDDSERQVSGEEIEIILQKLKANSEEVPNAYLSSNCWKWNRDLKSHKRPFLSINGESRAAARYAAMASTGWYRPDQLALHKCGFSHCVNPSHITFGSAAENSQDKYVHGTASKKLTFDQARSIRESTLTNKILANQYGISSSQVGHIKRGLYWKDT